MLGVRTSVYECVALSPGSTDHRPIHINIILHFANTLRWPVPINYVENNSIKMQTVRAGAELSRAGKNPKQKTQNVYWEQMN